MSFIRVMIMNNSRLAAWVFGVVCVVLCAAAHLRLEYTVIDDAFITYRYAARLATGEGLTYNDGERVLGTTTPGYALILAGAGSLFGTQSIPLASRLINLACLMIAAGFAVLCARRVTQSPLALAVIFCLFMLSPKTLIAGFSGMESALFMALACGAFWALLNERWALAAALFGMLPVVRPEGVFVVGLVVVVLGIGWARENFNYRDAENMERSSEKEHPSWRIMGVCALMLALPIAVWGGIATVYYGSPLPHSIVAKQAGLYPIGIVGSFLSLLGGLTETYGLFLLLPNSLSRLPTLDVTLSLLLFIALVGLVVAGGWRLARVQALFAVLPLYVLLMFVFYATSETLIFPQYYAFYEPIAKLCLWGGLALFIGRIVKNAVIAWGSAAVMTLLPSFVLFPYNSVRQPTMDLHELEVSTLRQPLYRSIAQQLDPLLPTGTVVLTPEIGELGFYLPNVHILDSAGLVSPQAVPYFPMPESIAVRAGVIPPRMAADYRPDLIVTLDVFIVPEILEADWFVENYTAVLTWTYDWLPLGSDAFYVFARNDFAAGMALRETHLQMEAPNWVGDAP
jgi:hypothetical protein